jgi:hypothetical protein
MEGCRQMVPRRNSNRPPLWGAAALVLACAVSAVGPRTALATADGPPSSHCVVADIHEIGWQKLDSLKRTQGLDWWVEVGGDLLMCGDAGMAARVAAERDSRPIDAPTSVDRIWIARGFDRGELAAMELEVVVGAGRLALVRAPGDVELVPATGAPDPLARRVLAVARPGTVVVRQAANEPDRERRLFAGEVQALVDEIDGNRWITDVASLATFNRYTHSPTIHDARDWLAARFAALPGVTVQTPSFDVSGTVAYNVIATIPGSLRPDDWYIVGGHYDATSEQPLVAAPGAEDNASGCAGVLELARAITSYPPEATVLFICYSGEEQGLLGSEDHVADLVSSGDINKVRAMIDLDMIAYTGDGDLDCLLESEPFAQFLVDLLADAAAQYTALRIEISLFAFGSDHVPYLEEGVPALLTIENDWYQYPYYHTQNDLPHQLTVAMGEEILRMNVAAVAELAGAGVAHVFSDGFESGGLSRWSSAVSE